MTTRRNNNKNKFYRMCFCMLVCAPAGVFAETAYVSDKLMAGIHQDNSTDSIIIKVIPTGTALEVLKREGELTQIKDKEGITGWVNNQFLVNTPPATALLSQAEDRANILENELEQARSKIKALESGNPTPVSSESTEIINKLKSENTTLKQQSKSAQLQVGELQAKLAELRNQMSQISSDPAMADKIKQLNNQKSELEQQVEALKSDNTNRNVATTGSGSYSWKRILITLLLALLIGMAIGAYILDLYNRQRHGGFRI